MFQTDQNQMLTRWVIIGFAFIAGCALLALTSPQFGYDFTVHDMPVLAFTAALVFAGALFQLLPRLIARTESENGVSLRPILLFVFSAGLVMRLILFTSEPVLEDDYQRYLWDGAVTANGINPYTVVPANAKLADPATNPLGRLAVESGPLLGRVNHPELRTLYPPVAEGFFALAYLIKPFSLTAWRALILGLDMAALALLVMLLGDLGRSPLWAALYWWNPLVLKELFNSVHMEAILVPLLLGGILLASRRRHLGATGLIVLAAGTKIWPALLLPLIWRPLLSSPKRLMAAIALALAAGLFFAAPMLTAGLNESSGLVAYATQWRTNSALFPLLEWIARAASEGIEIKSVSPSLITRLTVASIAGIIALWVARRPFDSTAALINSALIIVSGVFLLSPAQFPWYFLWVLPLIACHHMRGLLLATVTLPLYYTAFHFLARDNYAVFTDIIVWVIWIPVWIALLWELGLSERVRTILASRLHNGKARGDIT